MADKDLYRKIQEAAVERQEDLLALGIGGSTRRSGPTKTVDEAYADMVRLGLGPKPRVQPAQRAQPEEAQLGDDVNIYAALTGAPPSRRESQGAIADALRHRSRVGEIAALSGIPSLQSFGQNLMGQADSQAEALQRNRQAGIDDTRAQEYQDAQRAQWETQGDEGQRQNTMQFLTSLQNASQMTEGTGGVGGTGMRPVRLPKGERDELKDLSEFNRGVKDLDDLLSGRTLVNGKPVDLGSSLTRPLKIAASSNLGLETDNSRAIADAFASFERLWNIAKRKESFGATLTDNEKASWRAASPQSIWSSERLKEAIKLMRETGDVELENRSTSLAADGYNPDTIAREIGAHPQSSEMPGQAEQSQEGTKRKYSDEEEYELRKAGKWDPETMESE